MFKSAIPWNPWVYLRVRAKKEWEEGPLLQVKCPALCFMSGKWPLVSHTGNITLPCVIWKEFSRTSCYNVLFYSNFLLIKRTEDTGVSDRWRNQFVQGVRHIVLLPKRTKHPPLPQQSYAYALRLSRCKSKQKCILHFSWVFNCLIIISLWKLSRWWNHRSQTRTKNRKKGRYKKDVKTPIMNSCILGKLLI